MSCSEKKDLICFCIAGLIHGTKRWPYAKLVSLWDWLAPVIVAAHENLCVVDDRSLSLIPSMVRNTSGGSAHSTQLVFFCLGICNLFNCFISSENGIPTLNIG